MALSAAAAFSFFAFAPLLTLFPVSAPAPALLLLRAWTPAPASAPPFSETCYNQGRKLAPDKFQENVNLSLKGVTSEDVNLNKV